MLKLLNLLARGKVARATEDLHDRNALLILDQQIRETRAALERSRRALAVAIAGDQAEARRGAEIDARAADLEGRAVAALAAGRDDLAAEAADAIAELEAERRAIDEARTRFAAEVARIRATVADATRRQAELERGRRVAGATEAVRRLSAQTGRGDTATLREAEATLARLRALQAEATDTEAALAEADGADIAERLAREGFGPRTRPTGGDVLERLRRKAGLAPAA
ncbi:PspA/IM30 family protein [Methylobacterium sp. E-041]|jgi:phage shock protein A|uniref:PspA/IM30 family protein n=1 Tax=unclassified Methylobacterium TaxID=2615210 RepID=UPI001FB920E6|nr:MULTISPECIES: PspA/IM30 family protein [unclassified Methylobacterium]MCJ2006535.1 PspA/IM30 family protein [Methylobacterium sp. J-092]MCJ2106103.1 PspA/IM30 family protein [Methylobacterium sp. E-041]MCJ2110916.1 PspA/IM30 family protein [Methylobacterium sp. E-025]